MGKTWFDSLNAGVRHLIIAAAPIVAAAALTAIPALQKQYAGNAVIGLLLTMAVLYLTPITKQYGKGK